jgi:hypothetical protein
MGIEPTSEAWEASILPLYDARSASNATIIHNEASARTDGRFRAVLFSEEEKLCCLHVGPDKARRAKRSDSLFCYNSIDALAAGRPYKS